MKKCTLVVTPDIPTYTQIYHIRYSKIYSSSIRYSSTRYRYTYLCILIKNLYLDFFFIITSLPVVADDKSFFHRNDYTFFFDTKFQILYPFLPNLRKDQFQFKEPAYNTIPRCTYN